VEAAPLKLVVGDGAGDDARISKEKPPLRSQQFANLAEQRLAVPQVEDDIHG